MFPLEKKHILMHEINLITTVQSKRNEFLTTKKALTNDMNYLTKTFPIFIIGD